MQTKYTILVIEENDEKSNTLNKTLPGNRTE